MSIYDNVAAGLRVNGRLPRAELDAVVERALRQAALWDEVKDRLRASAMALSGGQQQRLCIARTIAPAPEVVLLDEPTASLDPQGTQRIEELLFELKQRVHHHHRDPQHAAGGPGVRHHHVLLPGHAWSRPGPPGRSSPRRANEQTEAYITGTVRMTDRRAADP